MSELSLNDGETEISLLLAFNNQLSLRDAYGWDRNQIYNFLQDVVENPVKYGLPEDKKADLESMRRELLRLSIDGNWALERNDTQERDGKDFRAGPGLWPDQHIYRARNPDWPRVPPPVSIFTVRQRLHQRKQGDNDDATDRPHRNLAYWSPYDLLGLFLSSMAPSGANKWNFYLPMTAVYGRWCRLVAGRRPGGGVGDHPYMFQCTWCEKNGEFARFSLGASLAGYDWRLNKTGTWEMVLKRERFNLLEGAVGVPMQASEYDFDKSPMREPERNGDAGTRFGNCAETYPFLDLMEGYGFDNKTCYGFALQRGYLETESYQEKYVRDKLWNPCGNCKKLIEWFAAQEVNFTIQRGSALRPR